MLSAKNFSPQQVAVFAALPTAVLVGIGALAEGVGLLYAAILVSVVFLFSFLIIFYTVQRFLYRRIKIIYKLIYQTKASKRQEFYYKNILPQKSINELNEDVEKWAENYTVELDTLKKNEAYRKDFLLNLSHELKTPVFAIQGYVDTLLNGALHNEDVNKKFLINASKNVDRLVNLLDDLDEISKLEMGEQSLFPENFVIQDIIKEVCELLSLKSEEKQIKCFIKKGCEEPVNVYADKQKIKQVLINLIDNAIKYGKYNGEIEGSIYRVDGKNILIEISDDGTGIAEEHLSRIFERFYRTDHARSRNIGGSGLGLAICKHIIEAHGSTIHVRSKIDVGSSFGFTLPASKNV
jgi:two-component system phosphate regulon sensor histidine kinase PhoR